MQLLTVRYCLRNMTVREMQNRDYAVSRIVKTIPYTKKVHLTDDNICLQRQIQFIIDSTCDIDFLFKKLKWTGFDPVIAEQLE